MNDLDIFKNAPEGANPQEIAEYLDNACQGDMELRNRVQALFQAERNLGSRFLNEAPVDLNVTQSDGNTEISQVSEKRGAIIGRYKLLERLGEGGFGTVWAAEQREPVRRRVALKIIKLGMDTKQIVGRFEAERQALALMDHPNIAKVLDAGSMENGRPYFVMELVRGIPITQFCDQESIATKERIDLFIKVCHALQHAHQKGIIHRDIKPSNILVTLHDGVPVPKVIDFGIAKATQGDLTDKTIYTQFQQFIGTPAYMSPEQAEMSGLDIDTRSDVYSLGVLLYELLTGSTPFDAKELAQSGIDAMRKMIREQEPVRPSTKLSQSIQSGNIRMSPSGAQEKETIAALRGDLDWIVMKCLEKDRSRRYETANGLALDLSRHLNHEPVLACPPSALYRFQKAWRRNKVAYTAGIAVAVSLTIGLSVSVQRTAEAKNARKLEAQQREVAETNATRATAEAIRAQTAEALTERQAEEFRHMAYAADMNQAQRAQELGNLGEALAFLNRHRPEQGQEDIRGWEWRYLRGLCQSSSLYKLATLEHRFFSFSMTVDGHWLFVYPYEFYTGSGSSGFTPIIFDLRGRKRGRLEWLPKEHMVLGLASKLPLILTASNEEVPVVRLTDYQSGQSHNLAIPNLPILARFSGNGNTLVTIHSFKHEDGQYEFRLLVWDTDTARLKTDRVLSQSYAKRIPELSERFAVSPDGATYTRLSDQDVTTLQLRDMATGKVIWETQTEDGILGNVTFTPDGKRVISTPDERSGRMKAWDSESGHLMATMSGHRAHVTSMSFMDEGRTLVSTSADHTIRLWKVETGEPLGMLRGHNEEVRAGIMHPDGKTFLSGSFDGQILVWRPSSMDSSSQYLQIQKMDGQPGRKWRRYWTYTADGQSILTINHDRHLYRHSGQNFQLSQRITDAPLSVSDICFGPNGEVAVTTDAENNLLRLDLQRDSLQQRILGDFGGRRPLMIDTNNNFVVLANRDEERTSVLVDLETGDIKNKIVLPAASAVLGASEDGAWLMAVGGSNKSSYRLFSTTHPFEHMVTLEVSTDVAYVMRTSFNPTQQLVAWTCEPHLTHVFSTQTGELLHAFNGHMNGAKIVKFTPDGSRLITGIAGDDAFKFWELRENRPLQLLTLKVDAMFRSDIRFSPDGNSMSSADQLGTIHIWRAPSWEEIEAMDAAIDD